MVRKKNLSLVMALLVAFSLVLSACGAEATPTPQAPAATETTAAPAPTDTTEAAAPTNTTAAMEETPTEAAMAGETPTAGGATMGQPFDRRGGNFVE